MYCALCSIKHVMLTSTCYNDRHSYKISYTWYGKSINIKRECLSSIKPTMRP